LLWALLLASDDCDDGVEEGGSCSFLAPVPLPVLLLEVFTASFASFLKVCGPFGRGGAAGAAGVEPPLFLTG